MGSFTIATTGYYYIASEIGRELLERRDLPLYRDLDITLKVELLDSKAAYAC